MVQTLWKAAGTGCWKPAMPKAINLQAEPYTSLAHQMQLLCKLLPSGCSSACNTPGLDAHPACAGFTQTRKRQRLWLRAALRDSRLLHWPRFRVSLCEMLLLFAPLCTRLGEHLCLRVDKLHQRTFSHNTPQRMPCYQCENRPQLRRLHIGLQRQDEHPGNLLS
jgi:hypothetical protein